MIGLPELNNTYIAMRHGLAAPNKEGLIVSHTDNGVLPEYGLVAEGIEQARESARAADLPEDIVVVTSPFSRAYQTAEVLYRVANADEFIVDYRLRERGFGSMEMQSAELYHEVWARDAENGTHRYRGAEPLFEIADRQHDAIAEYEQKFAKRVIVLVGHKDPLNVLKARLWGESLRKHRTAFSIDNGEMQTVATMRQS